MHAAGIVRRAGGPRGTPNERESHPGGPPAVADRTGLRHAIAGDVSGGARRYGSLIIGIGLVAAGSVIGLAPGAVDAVLNGPPVVRALLAGVAGLAGLWLLALAVGTLVGDEDADGAAARTFAEAIRGIRLAFLAIAAFAVASAFVVGHLLPLVVGLIVAGVDVAETALLLLVAGTHRNEDNTPR